MHLFLPLLSLPSLHPVPQLIIHPLITDVEVFNMHLLSQVTWLPSVAEELRVSTGVFPASAPPPLRRAP